MEKSKGGKKNIHYNIQLQAVMQHLTNGMHVYYG